MTGIMNKQVPCTFYAVLLGAARYVNDYAGGQRKSPNAQWFLDVRGGANRGAYESKSGNSLGLIFYIDMAFI